MFFWKYWRFCRFPNICEFKSAIVDPNHLWIANITFLIQAKRIQRVSRGGAVATRWNFFQERYWLSSWMFAFLPEYGGKSPLLALKHSPFHAIRKQQFRRINTVNVFYRSAVENYGFKFSWIAIENWKLNK